MQLAIYDFFLSDYTSDTSSIEISLFDWIKIYYIL